jgi:C-terminal processing protease CtpA/Prc
LADNILDFNIVYYEKKFPVPTVKQDIKEYTILHDKQAPKLAFVKKDLAVFTFPNFYGDSYEQLQYLLKKHEQKLSSTKYWIIDLRNNDGGDYRVGMQLLKYIYDKPMVDYNTEMRMTETNFLYWYNTYVKYTYENADTATKQELDSLFTVMKSNYGKMYNRTGAIADTIKLDKVYRFPQKFGFIINANTVSSGELFTIVARQSSKVTVFGSNSGGMMDYGDPVAYKINGSTIKVDIPLDRQLWLNEGFSVDKEGIKPDIYLSEENCITTIYTKLKKNGAKK